MFVKTRKGRDRFPIRPGMTFTEGEVEIADENNSRCAAVSLVMSGARIKR